MNTTLELAKSLVRIPSYVDQTCNEQEIINWLEKYCREKFPAMNVTQSPVDGSKRSNLYIRGTKPARLVFVGHVDTVPVSGDWLTNPLQPEVENDRLYGLGTADMKSSIAALLMALQQIDQTLLDEIAVYFYIDEEYDFAGMKQLIADKVISSDNPPDLVVSLDGSLAILTGCRGVIKLDMELLGKSGHASDPANGVNVIMAAGKVFAELEKQLASFSDPILGRSTMNVAYMRAGATDADNPTDMQRGGNVIPNYAQCILEVRPAKRQLNADELIRLVEVSCLAAGITMKTCRTSLDLGVWAESVPRDLMAWLRQIYKQANTKYAVANPKKIGFIDVQLLAETTSSPIVVIGAGGDNRHGPNESVPIDDIISAERIYGTIITNFFKEKLSWQK